MSRAAKIHQELPTIQVTVSGISIIFTPAKPHITITRAELLLAQCSLDSSKDLLKFSVIVDIAIAIDLAVERFSSDHLNLQLACGLRCSLSSNLQLAWELFLQLLLQLSELGGVPSSSAEKRLI